MFTQNKHPGKYEANISQLTARIVEDIVLNGFHTDEFGEAEHDSYFALVMGKRYGFIVHQDNNGFVTVKDYYKEEAKAKFNRLFREYEREAELAQEENQ